MGFYMLDHPNPRYQQYRAPRRAPISGVVVIHDAESIIDLIAPDTGAENVAGYIASRSDAGGYHSLHDSDSTIRMAPDNYETWHVAQHVNGVGYNWHAYGVSAACRTSDWTANPANPKYWWTVTTMANMARDVVRFWLENGFDPAVCARWLTRAQADARMPGLAHHGTVQPGDRSDAWATHPERVELDAMFLTALRGGIDYPAKDWFTMATKEDLKEAIREVLAEDDIKAGIATKNREELNGWLDAQRVAAGRPKGNGRNLDDVVHHASQRVMSSDEHPNVGDVINELRGAPTAP